jgi:hypothetical protein
MILKKTSVRVAEQLARRIAQDKIRKHDKTPEMMEIEKSLTETLGTRVIIENRPQGGRLLIEFFSPEDLSNIIAAFAAKQEAEVTEMLGPVAASEDIPVDPAAPIAEASVPNTTSVEEKPSDDSLYSVSNFSL